MQSSLTRDDIYSILRSDEEFMRILRSVATAIDSPWCVFGGQVRNRIWDAASGTTQPHISSDIDVGIFAPNNYTAEKEARQALILSSPRFEWDVENFAITHIENHDEPYDNLEDGLRKQLMTVMSVGATLDSHGNLVLISPLGLDDLASVIVRPTQIIFAHPDRIPLITQTIEAKQWQEKWPNLRIVQ